MATINQVLVNDVLYDIEVNAENVVGEVDKATVATKVGTSDKGSATQPVYLKAGVPTATTYKLEANVPSNAKFTDTTYSAATTSTAGLMSAADKTKLDGIATGANAYTLPAAGSSLGGVKTGGDVTIASGVITVNDDSHNHVISNIDNLQTTLNNKASQADISTALNNRLGSYSIVVLTQAEYDALTPNTSTLYFIKG